MTALISSPQSSWGMPKTATSPDFGEPEKDVLDFGGIDVGSARDDHVDLAVAEEQVAVLVDQTDVAHREELTDAVALGLLLVLVVGEVARLHGHVHGADHVGLLDAHAVVVEDGDLRYRPRLSDRPGLLKPFLGGDQGAAALGSGVVLVDGIAPPLDHLVLHVDRTGSGGVDHVLEGRHVVLGPGLLRQGEETVELRGHHVRIGDLVLLDELQHLLGDPLVHDHHRVQQVDGGSRVAQDSGVVEGGTDDVDVIVVRRDPEQEEDPRQTDGGLFGRGPAQRPEHPLGIARGARGVIHDVADGPVGRIAGRLGVAHPGIGPESEDLAHRETT